MILICINICYYNNMADNTVHISLVNNLHVYLSQQILQQYDIIFLQEIQGETNRGVINEIKAILNW